ncbi:MAG: tetratricopeptide repeat protein [Leptospiraceae bacterium]|nr:tetratricopeptide repeat protein [Leptospiraceae bacterium]
MLNKNFDMYLNLLEEVIELDESNAEAWFLRGLLFEKKGKIDQAIFCYRQVELYETQLILANIQLAKIYKKAGVNNNYLETKKKIIQLANNKKQFQSEIEALSQ